MSRISVRGNSWILSALAAAGFPVASVGDKPKAKQAKREYTAPAEVQQAAIQRAKEKRERRQRRNRRNAVAQHCGNPRATPGPLHSS